MTDEEKKSIEDLKEVVELYNDKCLITTEDDFKSIEILLNLIEKQSKEIEELKEKEKNLLIQLKDSEKELLEVCEKLRNSVSKDKIKAKIEEYKEKCKNCNFRGKICKEFKQNYNCTIAMCLKEFYSLLEKE